MPTTDADVRAAREQRNTAIVTGAANAINVTAETIAAVMQSNNALAIGRLNIQAAEALRHLMDEASQATTAEGALGTQRETQQQIQALTDLIHQLEEAQTAHPPQTTAQPIVTTPVVTPPVAKSHTALYVGLGIAGTAIVGGIAFFALRAKPPSHPHRNPWNSSSDALGGAAR